MQKQPLFFTGGRKALGQPLQFRYWPVGGALQLCPPSTVPGAGGGRGGAGGGSCPPLLGHIAPLPHQSSRAPAPEVDLGPLLGWPWDSLVRAESEAPPPSSIRGTSQTGHGIDEDGPVGHPSSAYLSLGLTLALGFGLSQRPKLETSSVFLAV